MKELNNIGSIMFDRNLTYRDVGHKAGLDWSTVQKIATFQRVPKQDTMIQISKALRLPVTDVFNLKY